jgi:tubulin gamma
MMLANHTSLKTVFQTIVDQYKKLRNRNAFLNQFTQTKVFADGDLTEFDNSEEVVRSLIDEYQASERMDYIDWGQEGNKEDDMQ